MNELKEIFGENIKLNEKLNVSTEKFIELFSDCNELSYSELKRVEEENNYGYMTYIEEWKEKGLLA
jgi:hypothetical protein